MKYVQTHDGHVLVIERDDQGNPVVQVTEDPLEVSDATATAYVAIGVTVGEELIVTPSPTPDTGVDPGTYLATRAWVENYEGNARTVTARSPDLIVTGAVTRNANGAATSAAVTWPDGTTGTYTADTLSTSFPGAVDGYHITYGSPVSNTYTQPTVTRDATGAVTAVPAIVVT